MGLLDFLASSSEFKAPTIPTCRGHRFNAWVKEDPHAVWYGQKIKRKKMGLLTVSCSRIVVIVRRAHVTHLGP